MARFSGTAGSMFVKGLMRAVLARVPPETKPAAARSAAPGRSGTAEAVTVAAAPLAASMRCSWPSRPKPVTSVAAVTPAARAAWLAAALSWVIEATAASTTSGGGAPRLTAVAITPVPTGLVKISWSPGAARSMVISRSGSARPTTARPYLGTGSSMVCPPAITQPASAATRAPPCRTWPSRAMSRPSPGQAARLTANSGRPPMAYTSDSALAAAIRPQSPGSSTIGVKKSVVRTRARSSSRRSTAASSASAAPISRSPWAEAAGGIEANMASSLASGSLQAQPAPGDREVRRGVTPLRYASGARLPHRGDRVRGPGDRGVHVPAQDARRVALAHAGDDQHAPGGVGVHHLLVPVAAQGVGSGKHRGHPAGGRRALNQQVLDADRGDLGGEFRVDHHRPAVGGDLHAAPPQGTAAVYGL